MKDGKGVGEMCAKKKTGIFGDLVRSLELGSSDAAAPGTSDCNCGVIGVLVRDKFSARAYAPHNLWNWHSIFVIRELDLVFAQLLTSFLLCKSHEVRGFLDLH